MDLWDFNKIWKEIIGDFPHLIWEDIASPNVPLVLITSCQSLDLTNTQYILQNNVSSNSTCFTINANNITLNGQGYSITYGLNGTGSQYGIYILGNTTTVSNFTLVEGNNSGTSKYGIYVRNTNNNTINNIIINTSGPSSYGIRIDSGSYNTLSNNIIITIGSADGIRMSPSNQNYNIISNNIITTSTSSARGIYSDSSFNNTFRNNYITTTHSTSEGIYFESGSDGNLFYDSFINASLTNDIYLSYSTSGTINFTNVTLGDSSGPNIDTLSPSRVNVHWYLGVYVNNGSNAVENANVTAKNVSGSIIFSQLTNSTGRIPIQIVLQYWRNGSTTMDQNNHTFNISKVGYPTLIKSINITSNRDEIFTLGQINSCATLNEADIVYYLGSDLSSTGTCINIVNRNITLNCNGFSITYATGGSSNTYGVDVSGNLSTIKNCNITEGTTTGGSKFGIRLNRVYNATLKNNIIRSIGTSSSYPIGFVASNGNNITENYLLAEGSSGYGIFIDDSNNNTVEGNNITSVLFYPLTINDISNGNRIVANNLTTNSSNWGSRLSGAGNRNNNLFINNIQLSKGGGLILITATNNLTMFSDYLSSTGTGSTAAGLTIFDGHHNFTLHDSILNATNVRDLLIRSSVKGGEWNLINVTNGSSSSFEKTWETGANGTLNVYWYLDIEVKNSIGNPINEANVTVLNRFNNFQFSQLTDTNGRIQKQILQDYKQNNTGGSSFTYYSNYTINVTKTGYIIQSKSINMSTNRFEIFNLNSE